MAVTKEDVRLLMEQMYAEEQTTREQGQKEYAHDAQNALRNFEVVGDLLCCPHCGDKLGRETVLLVYMLKHIFGIIADVNGERSQREPVQGRIKDARIYAALLRAMVEDRP